jgi:hypothetical protein
MHAAGSVVQRGLVHTPTAPAGPALSVARTRAIEAEANDKCLFVWLEQRPRQGCAMTTTRLLLWAHHHCALGAILDSYTYPTSPPRMLLALPDQISAVLLLSILLPSLHSSCSCSFVRREYLADPFRTRRLRSGKAGSRSRDPCSCCDCRLSLVPLFSSRTTPLRHKRAHSIDPPRLYVRAPFPVEIRSRQGLPTLQNG